MTHPTSIFCPFPHVYFSTLYDIMYRLAMKNGQLAHE